MKKLLIVLFVTCFCKQIVFANDIEDLKIEGISVGDSALDFFTEDEIKSRSKSYPGNKRFTPVYNDKLDFFKTYDAVDFEYKSNDSKYIIHSVSGVIDWRNKKMSDCYKKMDEIISSLDELMKDFRKTGRKNLKHPNKKRSGTYVSESFFSDRGRVAVTCYDYEPPQWDFLSVTVHTLEHNDFLLDEAYN